jgi:hypothetical protein
VKHIYKFYAMCIVNPNKIIIAKMYISFSDIEASKKNPLSEPSSVSTVVAFFSREEYWMQTTPCMSQTRRWKKRHPLMRVVHGAPLRISHIRWIWAMHGGNMRCTNAGTLVFTSSAALTAWDAESVASRHLMNCTPCRVQLIFVT